MAIPASLDVARLEAALNALPPRRRVNVLLNVGVPAEEVIGTRDCMDHYGWRLLHDFAPLTFDLTTLWCCVCWRWYRDRA